MASIFETSVECCEGPGAPACVCAEEERVLRAYMRGDESLPPMNHSQRSWCLEQIGETEGFDNRDYLMASDQGLAAGVLAAWLSYCRDKGMIG